MTIHVPLTRGFVALIDVRDAERVLARRWNAQVRSHSVYAAAPSGGPYLHRFVLDASRGSEVDHIDGDGLNNRRSNLRICARGENARNAARHRDSASEYKGVRQCTGSDVWTANISADGTRYYLGTFPSAIEAALAYDAAAIRLHGEHARTNASLGLLSQVEA